MKGRMLAATLLGLTLAVGAPEFTPAQPPATGEVIEHDMLAGTLPEGWTLFERRGVVLVSRMDSRDAIVNILIEQERSESASAIAAEHGGRVVPVGRGGAVGCFFPESKAILIAAKGDKGTYLEIGCQASLAPEAVGVVRSLAAADPRLAPALKRLQADEVLEYLGKGGRK